MPKITRSMPLQTVQRILHEKGVERVSVKALEVLSEFLENLIGEIGKEAEALARHTGRMTVKDKDIKFVLNSKFKKYLI